MPDKEYIKAREERAAKDKKISMIIFPIIFLSLVAAIVFIVNKV